MARLKKGILGTPQGIIAGVNCYERLGKGIIQKRSKVVNKVDRWFNLYRSTMLIRLARIYETLPLGNKNLWDADAPPGFNGSQWFIESYIILAKSLHRSNIGAFNPSPPATINNVSMLNEWSSTEKYANIVFNPDSLYWTSAGDKKVEVRGYSSTGTLLVNPLFTLNGGNPSFTVNLSNIDNNDVYRWALFIITHSPFVVYGNISIDVFP